MRNFQKDPSEQKIYEFDWTDVLGSASILTSTWTIAGSDAVLTKDNDTIVSGGKRTRVRIKAGTLGVRYTVTNTVVTDEIVAQTFERSFYVTVTDL